MKQTHRGILTLLKIAVTGRECPLPEGFTLEDANEIIQRQHLWPLAYEAALRCGFSPKTELMQLWRRKYYHALFQNERQLAALEQVLTAFRNNGISHMLLKGVRLKKLYPRPELRSMGDADILIHTEQYDRIKPLLLELGFHEGVETQHELVWDREDLHLELHKCLFAKRLQDFYHHFGDGWKLAVPCENHSFELTPEDEFVYLFTHMAKHYRASGIGIQHVLDLYLYRAAHPEMDEARIRNTLSRLHLLEFYRNILELFDVWFGDKPSGRITDLIIMHILCSGVWGDRETQFYSAQVKKNARSGKIHSSKLDMIWDAVFLPFETMQCRHRSLFRFPWLYPFFLVCRWVKLILLQPRKIFRKLRRVNQVQDEKTELRRRSLETVGLGFYFDSDETE